MHNLSPLPQYLIKRFHGWKATSYSENAAWFRRELAQFEDLFDFQEETPKGYHSWFGFTIRLKNKAPFSVTELTRHLNAAHIETRPIIAGNIARQPAFKLYEHRTVGDMKHANAVMDRAFSFGNHQAIDSGARDYVTSQIRAFIRQKG